MMELVLIHSPLLSPLCWAPLVASLKGMTALVPQLSAGDADWRAYVADVRAAIPAQSSQVCLVFHSGAGVLAGALVDALPGRVGAMIFIDAMVPRPGLSRLQCLQEEMNEKDFKSVCSYLDAGNAFPKWSERTWEQQVHDPDLRRSLKAEFHPKGFGYWNETIEMSAAFLSSKALYIRCSAVYRHHQSLAAQYRWDVQEYDSTHLGIVNEPGVFAHRIAAWLERLPATGR